MTGEKHVFSSVAWLGVLCVLSGYSLGGNTLFSSLRFPFAAGLAVGYVLLSEDLASGDCSGFFLFFPLILRLFCGTRGEGKKEVWALLQLKGHRSVKGLVQRC